jgi:hypothetical protein
LRPRFGDGGIYALAVGVTDSEIPIFDGDDPPPTLRDPSQDVRAARERDPEPKSTQWFTEAEFARLESGARESADAAEVGRKAVEDAINEAILAGCTDLFVETGGRKAFAVVLSPRMYQFAAARMRDVFTKGYVELRIGYGGASAFERLFGGGDEREETVTVPIYLQVPCYTSDLRMAVVMYPTLERMRDSGDVLHSLQAAKAMAVLGFDATAFEEAGAGA